MNTPRTYAAKIKSGFAAIPDGFYDHARGLETELNAATAERDQLRADRTYNHECINRLAVATGTLGEKSEKVVDVVLSTIDQLRAELKAERAIVSRIWTQLGSLTYAQLKGRSIYDLIEELKADLTARLKRDYEYGHKCLYEVRERCESWKQRAERAEAELTKYLSACPASPTEEERKRCQQWWAISGRSP